MTKKAVQTDKAPAAIGPYSQGIIAQGLLFTAGQIALDPKSGQFVGGDIRQQARQVIENLRGVLGAAGCTFQDVVKTTVFLTSMDDYATLNEVYGEYFGESKPARSAVAVAALPKGAKVEIELVALVPK